MLALSDSQLRSVWAAATSLPIEKRGVFLGRLVAQLQARRSHYLTADLDDAVERPDSKIGSLIRGSPLPPQTPRGSIREAAVHKSQFALHPAGQIRCQSRARLSCNASEAYPMTNLLEQAINCDDGDRAAKIIQDALGIEPDYVVNHCFPRDWPADGEVRARIIGGWLQAEAQYLA